MNIIVTNVPNPNVKVFSVDLHLITNVNFKQIPLSLDTIKRVSISDDGIRIEKEQSTPWGDIIFPICEIIYGGCNHDITYLTITEQEIQKKVEKLYTEIVQGLDTLKDWLDDKLSYQE